MGNAIATMNLGQEAARFSDKLNDEWQSATLGSSEHPWFAAYTSANHEKRVAEQLMRRDVEFYLPLYRSVRRWKDRRVELQVPLFPGYLFVRLPVEQKRQVLDVRGVAHLVGFSGCPAPISSREIENVRKVLCGDLNAAPHPYLSIGRRVRVVGGALDGLIGILLRKKANWRLVLSIDAIKRSLAVEVDASDVLPA